MPGLLSHTKAITVRNGTLAHEHPPLVLDRFLKQIGIHAAKLALVGMAAIPSSARMNEGVRTATGR